MVRTIPVLLVLLATTIPNSLAQAVSPEQLLSLRRCSGFGDFSTSEISWMVSACRSENSESNCQEKDLAFVIFFRQSNETVSSALLQTLQGTDIALDFGTVLSRRKAIEIIMANGGYGLKPSQISNLSGETFSPYEKAVVLRWLEHTHDCRKSASPQSCYADRFFSLDQSELVATLENPEERALFEKSLAWSRTTNAPDVARTLRTVLWKLQTEEQARKSEEVSSWARILFTASSKQSASSNRLKQKAGCEGIDRGLWFTSPPDQGSKD